MTSNQSDQSVGARPSAAIKIALLGAGNMGTAMAQMLAVHGHEVALWDHFRDVVQDIRLNRENRRFLPGARLHPGITATDSAEACVAGAMLVVVGVPSPFVASTLAPALPAMKKEAVLLNVAKGFEPGTRQPMPFMLNRLAPAHACVHLAGPAIANELARGVPAAIVLAAEDATIAKRVADWLAGPSLMPGITTDVMGAALGGILKNVYAILLGCLDTLSADARNLEAAAVSASVNEMAMIAAAHGGEAATLYGMAGLGDLVATGFSRDSHNRRFGNQLAGGQTAAEIEQEIGWLPEGARAAASACAIARDGKVSAPLANLVQRWIDGTPPSLHDFVRIVRDTPKHAS